ncbi:MAG: hypothetical protein K940chlam3_00525 [Chlamydiae bacterium]|nr:hypothetical protein [Chlamydiota bacterium]
MRFIPLVFLTALLASSSVSGALTPFYQSTSEIDAILENDDLQENLGTTRLITAIVKNEKGWLIQNDTYEVQVNVQYEYSGKLGPVNFELSFEEPQKIKKSNG